MTLDMRSSVLFKWRLQKSFTRSVLKLQPNRDSAVTRFYQSFFCVRLPLTLWQALKP